MKDFPSLATAAEFLPEGWKIVKDVAPTLKSAADLEAVSFLEPGDKGYIPSKTMLARAKIKKANLGLADIKVALADPAKIRVEEGVFCIIFSGTVLRHPAGNLCVACLRWDGKRWVVGFIWFTDDRSDGGRLARCKDA